MSGLFQVQLVQPPAPGPDPEIVLQIDVQADNHVVAEAGGFSGIVAVIDEFVGIGVITRQASECPDPKPAFAIGDDRRDIVVCQAGWILRIVEKVCDPVGCRVETI